MERSKHQNLLPESRFWLRYKPSVTITGEHTKLTRWLKTYCVNEIDQLNPQPFVRDNWIRQGLYPGIQVGSVLGSDGVGVVVEGDDALKGKQVVIVPGKGWDSDPRGPEGKYGILGLLPLAGENAFQFHCVLKHLYMENF